MGIIGFYMVEILNDSNMLVTGDMEFYINGI